MISKDPIDLVLKTKRLLLRAINPSLIHHLFNTRSHNDIKIFFGIDENGFNHLLSMHEHGMETHRISVFFFLIIEKNTNRPIGDCGFHTLNMTHRRTELFYLLRNDVDKNKGYMTEALATVINYGFSNLGLHRIEAKVASNNIPSLKLLKHFNFKFEGITRQDYVVDGVNEDSDCYSLLKHEFINN